jgi:hypothetical protein
MHATPNPEALAAAIVTIQQLAEANREGQPLEGLEHVPGLRRLVHEIALGKTYAEIQAGRWGKRSREKRQRNAAMAREFRRRELAYELRSERISFGDLAVQIGRLPEFRLRRSAAIEAIKAGLRSTGHSG